MSHTFSNKYSHRRTAKALLQTGVAVVALVVHAAPGFAQSSLSEDSLAVVPKGKESEIGFSNGSFIAVPIPFSNPTLGNGLAAGVAWLFSADENSNTSSIGFGGFRSDNGSEGVAFSLDLSFLSDRYSVSFLAGDVSLEYDFTSGPFDFPLKQTGELYKLEGSYGFTPEFSVGLGVNYAETTLSTNFNGILPPEVSLAADLEVFKFGIISQWDRRDNDIYPTTGSLVTLDIFRGDVTGSVDLDYDKAVVQGSYFRAGLRSQDVIAFSATGCKTSNNAPFFDACSIGLTDGLRGFSVTDYIGDSLVSVQAEYRGRFGDSPFGYAAFAGAGVVNGTLTSEAGTHSAAGLGLRYRLSNSFPVDFSADVTINSDDDTLYYIYVGQSF